MSNNYFMVLDFNKDIKSFKLMRDTYKDNDNKYKIKINNNDKKIEEGDIVYIGVLNLPDDSSRLFLKTIVAYKEKDDMLFITLIFAVFLALIVIVIQSRKYNDYLYKINPSYYFPTILELIMNTTILTLILLVLKILFEKAFHFYINCSYFHGKIIL